MRDCTVEGCEDIGTVSLVARSGRVTRYCQAHASHVLAPATVADIAAPAAAATAALAAIWRPVSDAEWQRFTDATRTAWEAEAR